MELAELAAVKSLAQPAQVGQVTRKLLLCIRAHRIPVHDILYIVDRGVEPSFVELAPAQAAVEVRQMVARIFIAIMLPSPGPGRALDAHEVVLNASDQSARLVVAAAALAIPVL